MALVVNDFGAETVYGELEFKRAVVQAFRDVLVSLHHADLTAATVSYTVAPITGNIVAVGATLEGALTVGTPTLAFATDMATPKTFVNVAGATALSLTQASSGAGSNFEDALATPFAITRGRAIRVTTTVNSQATVSACEAYVVIRHTDLTIS